MVSIHTQTWEAFYKYWLGKYPGEKLVVHYENLKQDTRAQVRRMTEFVGVPVTDAVLKCTTETPGSHQRLHEKDENGLNIFTRQMLWNISKVFVSVKSLTDEEFSEVYYRPTKKS